MMRCRLSLGLAICVALATRTVLADGLVRDGIGAISTGRGGTNLGFSDNAAVLIDNPAGIVNVSGTGLAELGVDTVFTDLDYTDPENSHVSGKFRPFPAGQFGFFRKTEDGRLAYGFGVFAPAGFGAEYDINSPGLGNSVYKSIGMLGKVLPGVAIQVTDRLSIGGTFGLAISHVEFEGPFYLQSGILKGTLTQFDFMGRGVTPTGSVGMQYQLSSATTLGASYTEESRFLLAGTANAQVAGLPALDSHFDAEMDLVWPRSFGVGVKHQLNECSLVSADVIWFGWAHAFDQVGIKLTDPTNPVYRLLGPEIRDAIPMNWNDTISVRLGYEWQSSFRDTWRLGYVYHESPCPNESVYPYTDGVLEHAFAAGLSRDYGGYLFNIAYQYSFSPVRHVGESAMAGGDFSNSTYQAQAHWLSLSVLKRF